MLSDILTICKAKIKPRPTKRTELSVREAGHKCERFLRYPGLDGGFHGWRGYRCWDCLKIFFTSEEKPLYTFDYEKMDLVPKTEA